MGAFCEQLASCPSRAILWWSVNKLHRLFNRKTYCFPAEVLLELLVNHFCLSRGEASVLLEIPSVWAASLELLSSERAGFPWANDLFGSDVLWMSW